jgi:hypothetical protein
MNSDCMNKEQAPVINSLTIDLRGTPYQGQLEFLCKIDELCDPGEVIEILSCDDSTLANHDSWINPCRHELVEVIRENGYYRILVKLHELPQ